MQAELQHVKEVAAAAAAGRSAAEAELLRLEGVLAEAAGANGNEEQQGVLGGWKTQELDRLRTEVRHRVCAVLWQVEAPF